MEGFVWQSRSLLGATEFCDKKDQVQLSLLPSPSGGGFAFVLPAAFRRTRLLRGPHVLFLSPVGVMITCGGALGRET